MAVAAGFHSPHVRAARLLHTKKHRAEARCFLIEGPALIEAALDSGVVPGAVFCIANGRAELAICVERAQHAGAPVYAVDERTLASLAQTRTPQGVVAQVAFIDREVNALPTLLPLDGPAIALILDDLDDPGNAGTLVRSAEAFGASAVCFGANSVEPYNDKLVRASMGALFRVPIVRYADWSELAGALTNAGLTLVGAAAGAPDIRSVELPKRSALVLGNERHGLHAVPAGAIAVRVGIPQRPAGESLNVAVAGSIVLYELARCGLRLGTEL
ncbi:MAG TPA: RNA methyltransferase [Magnetospirillaceae bacterium]|nr:RNA methyltransferase [Magnetospirillaceae bacterium]